MQDEKTEEKAEIRFRYLLKIPLWLLILSTIFMLIIIIVANPNTGPIAVVLFLLTTLVLFASVAAFALQASLSVLGSQNFTSVKLFYASVLLAVGLTFLIGLRTLNQLQLIDIVLVFTLEIIALFYLNRRF